jgi:hypothetical protein
VSGPLNRPPFLAQLKVKLASHPPSQRPLRVIPLRNHPPYLPPPPISSPLPSLLSSSRSLQRRPHQLGCLSHAFATCLLGHCRLQILQTLVTLHGTVALPLPMRLLFALEDRARHPCSPNIAPTTTIRPAPPRNHPKATGSSPMHLLLSSPRLQKNPLRRSRLAGVHSHLLAFHCHQTPQTLAGHPFIGPPAFSLPWALVSTPMRRSRTSSHPTGCLLLPSKSPRHPIV